MLTKCNYSKNLVTVETHTPTSQTFSLYKMI